MIMPVTLSVITSSFPVEERAKAVGTWSGFAGAGGILGLFVSSFLIDRVAWPWLFAMPIGFAVVALVMTVRFVGNSREDACRTLRRRRLGALGAGDRRTRARHPRRSRDGLDRCADAVGPVVGVLALIGFVVWELRVHPILDLRVFRDRALATGSVTLLIVFAVLMGIFLVLIQFLQAVVGYSALRAATGLLPMAAVMMPLSTAAPSIAKRIGTAHNAADRRRAVRWRSGAARHDGLGRGRLLVDPARSARARCRHRPADEPLDDGDHRVAARGASGRGVGPQRHGARVRRCRRHRPAGIGVECRLSVVGQRLDR